MLRTTALALTLLCCCNEQQPLRGVLGSSETLAIVAHPDDDVLFMQPAVVDALKAGSLTTVYMTSGEGRSGREKGLRRLAAMRRSYSELAARGGIVSEWQCGTVTLAGRPTDWCYLPDTEIQVVSIAIPDGGKRGEVKDSMLALLSGAKQSIFSKSKPRNDLTAEIVVSQLSGVIGFVGPRTIHTLDFASTGYDHSDHMIAGAFALLGMGAANYNGAVVVHQGYNVADAPANLPDAQLAEGRDMLGYYLGCLGDCGSCGEVCPKISDAHTTWIERQYSRRAAASHAESFFVKLGDRCVGAQGNQVVVASCGSSPAVQLRWQHHNGSLKVAGQCLTTDTTGNLSFGECAPVPEQYWLIEENQSIWSGSLGEQAAMSDYRTSRCLRSDGDSVKVGLCGEQDVQRWELVKHEQ